MTVTWRSEFNGGDTQIFNVQWSNLNTNTTITSNAIQNEGEGVYHIFTTELLLPSSLYIVIIKASNTHATVVSEEMNCTTNALPKKGKSESATIGIIGGTLGFVCALLVVTGMLIILRRRRRQKEDKEPIKGSKDSEVEQNDDDGLKENPLYVASGQTKDNDNGPLYSEVKKPKKGPPVEIKDENAIYSQVEKTVKKGKQKKKEKNTRKEWENGIQDKGIELGSVYENSEKLMKTHSPEENANTYGNSGDVSTNGQGYNVTRNKDGLIYADLDLKPDANGRRFIIRGIENRNNYAILDLTKTAEPLPSDDSDDEKQISELTDDNGNTK
ncbi:uncharacterized protein LOC143078040 [Mytilus galloprovincialis]|uniref:uncharacterized protein LOC143078040 n=1 Tax=Mytilus galloprovincialis TaxID=29158 RepID=UPI003F7BC97F